MTSTTRIPCLLLVWLLAARTLAAQQTLYLLDGDRLTGHLVRIAEGQWVFRYGGAEIKLPGSTVTGLLAPDPVGVRLADSTIGAARVAPVPSGLALTFTDGTTYRSLKVPSGAQSGIKVKLQSTDADTLVPYVTITPGQAILVVDFDVSQNFKIQGNPNTPAGLRSILFTPVLRAVVRNVAGSIAVFGAVETV